MHKKYTNRILLFLKKVISSLKSFQEIFRLFETIASILLMYLTHKKIPSI